MRPGGRFLSLDFDRPDNQSVRAVYFSYLTVVGSILGLLLHGDPDTYRYIPQSLRTYPGSREVGRMLKVRGFEAVAILPVLGGFLAMHLAQRPMEIDSSAWSGERTFTQLVLEKLRRMDDLSAIRVEDAPSTRSEADYNFVSNEIFVRFEMRSCKEPGRRFGFLPATRVVTEKCCRSPSSRTGWPATERSVRRTI